MCYQRSGSLADKTIKKNGLNTMLLSLTIFALVAYIPLSESQENYTLAEGLELFTSLYDVLNYFRNHSSPLARDILRTFESDCPYVSNPAFSETTMKPFIVILGNHRTTRQAVGMRLAQALAGRYMAYPAPCLNRFIKEMPRGTLLRRAFYFLSNYASAFYAKIQLALDKPVILNGYYHEQLVFSLVNSFTPDQMPPITSDLFRLPADLLKPNLVFFVHMPDRIMYKTVTTRNPLHWNPRTVDLFKQMRSRHPIVIQEATRFARDTVDSMYYYVRNHLYHRGRLWHHDPPANDTAFH